MITFKQEFETRIENIIALIEDSTDELWDIEYPQFLKNHSLKDVLKASIFLEVQQRLQTSLLDTMIAKEK